MMRRSDSQGAPSAKELAAYVDGELDPVSRSQVEAWLAQHPEAGREVDGLRNLSQLWQATPPPEASEAAWRDLFTRINTALPGAAAATIKPSPARRSWRRWLGVASVAAALALVILSRLPLSGPQGLVPEIDATPELFPITESHDVTILSMDDTETFALVVGEPPPLVLVTAIDVAMGTIEPDPTDGMMPKVPPMIAQTDTPMIVAPLDW
jgi:anti-sigma factor RsiW